MTNPSLPALTENQLLPEGIHDGSLNEVEDVFGRFQRTDRRSTLFAKLEQYLEEVRKADWDVTVILNGSFVMAAVDDPGDIDLILVFPAEWDFTAELRPSDYNLMSKSRVRRKYGFDVFAVRAGSNDYNKWVEFFQRIRPERRVELGLQKGLNKGIVRIVP